MPPDVQSARQVAFQEIHGAVCNGPVPMLQTPQACSSIAAISPVLSRLASVRRFVAFGLETGDMLFQGIYYLEVAMMVQIYRFYYALTPWGDK